MENLKFNREVKPCQKVTSTPNTEKWRLQYNQKIVRRLYSSENTRKLLKGQTRAHRHPEQKARDSRCWGQIKTLGLETLTAQIRPLNRSFLQKARSPSGHLHASQAWTEAPHCPHKALCTKTLHKKSETQPVLSADVKSKLRQPSRYEFHKSRSEYQNSSTAGEIHGSLGCKYTTDLWEHLHRQGQRDTPGKPSPESSFAVRKDQPY